MPHACAAIIDASRTFFINSKTNAAIQKLGRQSYAAIKAKVDAVRMHGNGTALGLVCKLGSGICRLL